MKKPLILAIPVLLFALCLNAGVEREYDIIKGKKTLGILKVKMDQEDNVTNCHIHSLVKFWFFGTRKVEYEIKNHFEDKQLKSCLSRSTLNEKPRHTTTTRWDGNRYQFEDVDEEEKFSCDTSYIDFTLAFMYFQEPIGIQQIYSERYLEYLPVTDMGDHRYQLTLPNGTKNYFSYENGICTEVEVNHPLAKFFFKLRKESDQNLLAK